MTGRREDRAGNCAGGAASENLHRKRSSCERFNYVWTETGCCLFRTGAIESHFLRIKAQLIINTVGIFPRAACVARPNREEIHVA